MDDENLLSGDGSPADFLNSTGADAIYADNQSVADQLENGTVTSSPSATSISTPGWQSTLTSLFTTAGAAVNTVAPLTGSTTTGTPPAAAKAAAATRSSKTLWIVLGVIGAVIAGFLFLKK